jgi:hypothetical protein
MNHCPHCHTMVTGVEKYCPTCHNAIGATLSDEEIAEPGSRPEYVGTKTPGTPGMTAGQKAGQVAAAGCLGLGVVATVIFLIAAVFLLVLFIWFISSCAGAFSEASESGALVLALPSGLALEFSRNLVSRP